MRTSGGILVRRIRTIKKRLREPVNGLTHAAGGVLAFVGLFVLVASAASAGRMDQIVAFGIFGISLVALYIASSLYHLLPLSPAGVARLRKLDHVAIFVLIAGTYTPFCLLALDGGWRWGVLAIAWGLALCGASLKLLWMEAPRWLSVLLYLGMGWVAVVAVPALLRSLPAGGDRLGACGGTDLQRGRVSLRVQAPEPHTRGVWVPRAAAPLRSGRKRLPFLGGAALRRPARVEAGLGARAHKRAPMASKVMGDGRGIVIVVAKTSRRCLS
jgi:hemolysin III